MKTMILNVARFSAAACGLCILTLVSGPAMAQSGTIDNTGANDRAKVTTNRMAADLNLNDTQREQLLEQNTAHHLNQQSVHQHGHSDEERIKLSQKYERTYENNLKQILDNDQYERYRQQKANYNLSDQRLNTVAPTDGRKEPQPQRKR